MISSQNCASRSWHKMSCAHSWLRVRCWQCKKHGRCCIKWPNNSDPILTETFCYCPANERWCLTNEHAQNRVKSVYQMDSIDLQPRVLTEAGARLTNEQMAASANLLMTKMMINTFRQAAEQQRPVIRYHFTCVLVKTQDHIHSHCHLVLGSKIQYLFGYNWLVHIQVKAPVPVRTHCTNAWWNRCKTDLNSFPCRKLDETTGTSSYYMDENHSAGSEIQRPQYGRRSW